MPTPPATFVQSHPRLVAGIWFALFALIPGTALMLMDVKGGFDTALMLYYGPIFSGAAAGVSMGWRIIPAPQRNTGVRYGIFTTLLAYAFYALFVWITIVARILPLAKDQPAGEMIGGIFAALGVSFALIFTIGMLLVGWWSVLLGAVAGWVLSALTGGKDDRPDYQGEEEITETTE